MNFDTEEVTIYTCKDKPGENAFEIALTVLFSIGSIRKVFAEREFPSSSLYSKLKIAAEKSEAYDCSGITSYMTPELQKKVSSAEEFLFVVCGGLEEFYGIQEVFGIPSQSQPLKVSKVLENSENFANTQEMISIYNFASIPETVFLPVDWDETPSFENIAKVLKRIPTSFYKQGYYMLQNFLASFGCVYVCFLKFREHWIMVTENQKQVKTWTEVASVCVARGLIPSLLTYKKHANYKPTSQYISNLDYEKLLSLSRSQDKLVKLVKQPQTPYREILGLVKNNSQKPKHNTEQVKGRSSSDNKVRDNIKDFAYSRVGKRLLLPDKFELMQKFNIPELNQDSMQNYPSLSSLTSKKTSRRNSPSLKGLEIKYIDEIYTRNKQRETLKNCLSERNIGIKKPLESFWKCLNCFKQVPEQLYECTGCGKINWNKFYDIKKIQNTVKSPKAKNPESSQSFIRKVFSPQAQKESNERKSAPSNGTVQRTFTFGEDNWECKGCYSTNDSSTLKCLTCNLAKDQKPRRFQREFTFGS